MSTGNYPILNVVCLFVCYQLKIAFFRSTPIVIQRSTCPICWTHRPERMNSFAKNADKYSEPIPVNWSRTWKPFTQREKESKVSLCRPSPDRICAKCVEKTTLNLSTYVSIFASAKVRLTWMRQIPSPGWVGILKIFLYFIFKASIRLVVQKKGASVSSPKKKTLTIM